VVEIYRDGSSKVIGKHQGAHFYTIGQRKGLHIGGHKRPLFVLSTDVETNTVYVGEGQDHPGLYHCNLTIREKDIHWIRPDLTMQRGEERQYSIRIRYRQPLQDGVLQFDKDMQIHFREPQRGITPGQFAAWYNGEELIGSGVITTRS
jgi:tRNA-specific 2-thiouridylase